MSTRPNINQKIPSSFKNLTTGKAFSVPEATEVFENTSGVRRRKPKGFLFPLAYSFNRDVYYKARGSTTQYAMPSGVLQKSITGCIGANVGGTDTSLQHSSQNNFNDAYMYSFPSHLSSAAYYDAAEGMKGMRVNLAQAFAERNQVVNLVTNTASDMVKLYRAARKGDYNKFIHVAGKYKKPSRRTKQSIKRQLLDTTGKPFSQKWLELQYGWKPLISDVYGSIALLSEKPKESFYFTAHGTKRSNLDFTKRVGTGDGFADVKVSGFHLCKWTLLGVPTNEPIDVFRKTGIANPALLAWELIPFSFVADWFIPVGSYLDSFDALLGYDKLRSCETKFSKVLWYETGVPFQNSLSRYTNTFEGYREYVNLVRSVKAEITMPPLPRFRNPVSVSRMTSAISLLTQIFGSKIK